MEGTARRTRRRTVTVLVLALVVLGGATLVTWATGSGPFREQGYCWGAWDEGSGPQVLGDDYARVAKETGSPERGGQATCAMAFGPPGTEEMKHADTAVDADITMGGEATGEREMDVSRLVARVGPPPRSTGEPRRAWLAEALHGNAALLPEGLPGVVSRDRGTLVLPQECDSGGVPLVVTVHSQGWVPELDSEQDVAELLLSLADTAREKAGCSEGEPSRFTAPVTTGQDGETFTRGTPACRVPGMQLDPPRGGLEGYAGAAGDRLQTCSLELSGKNENIAARGQFVVTSHPRLTALFAGMAGDTPPGEGWRGKGRIQGGNGLVAAECRGRNTVFYLHLDDALDKSADPDTERVFARSVNSVAERLGCPAVGPHG